MLDVNEECIIDREVFWGGDELSLTATKGNVLLKWAMKSMSVSYLVLIPGLSVGMDQSGDEFFKMAIRCDLWSTVCFASYLNFIKLVAWFPVVTGH